MTLHETDDRAARDRVPALARGLAILEAVAAGASSATAASLASRLDVPRNSIARLLRTLVRHAFLVVDAHGRYRPGPAAARVAAAYLGARPEVAHAQPVLDALCARSGLAAQLLGRDGAEVVVLAQAAPDGAACLVTRVGARFAGRTGEAADDESDAADAGGRHRRDAGGCGRGARDRRRGRCAGRRAMAADDRDDRRRGAVPVGRAGRSGRGRPPLSAVVGCRGPPARTPAARYVRGGVGRRAERGGTTCPVHSRPAAFVTRPRPPARRYCRGGCGASRPTRGTGPCTGRRPASYRASAPAT